MSHRARLSMIAAVMAATALVGIGAVGSAQDPSPGVIPLTPISDLTSLDATVTIGVDGTINGKPKQGELTAVLTSNAQAMSRIDVTGNLLGDVVAQVGGSAVKLFRPKSVGIYTVPDGTYAVVSGLLDLCVKPADFVATETLGQLSPQRLMTILTGSDVARGTFVGDETLDGAAVKHYVIDGAAFLTAAQASSDPNVSAFASAITSATDADLYVSADGGYPVAYHGGFSGAFAPLAFEGDLTVDIALTGINNDPEIVLPGSCDNPIPA